MTGKKSRSPLPATKVKSRFYLKLLHIADLVDAHTSKGDVAQSKPQPGYFFARAQSPPSAADDAIVIGDTPYDIAAAKKIGLPTIAVLCGGFAEDELRAEGAVAIFRDPADLLANYPRSPLPLSRA